MPLRLLVPWNRCSRHGLCLDLAACRQVRHCFSVRVMIPCYTEDNSALSQTLEGAVKATEQALRKNMANAGQLKCSLPRNENAHLNGTCRLGGELLLHHGHAQRNASPGGMWCAWRHLSDCLAPTSCLPAHCVSHPCTTSAWVPTSGTVYKPFA